MKQISTFILSVSFILLFSNASQAQCGSPVNMGSSSNMFTLIRNSTNPIAADKNLNTVVYVHRNNASTYLGNSGQLRYDVSTNAGSTWSIDIGVVNPLTTHLARYPNAAIYNPTNNINPSNAYFAYMAATINSVSSAWNGVVTGVQQLNGTGTTESYNQPVINPQLIPHSVVKGAPGIFWAVDALFNGSNITGFAVYKGTWNAGSNDIVWAHNFSVTPSFNTGLSATPVVGDYNIAFDPTGTTGWFSFLGHVSPGPSNYALYPIFYKTTNGGQSWTGPFQVNLNQFSCLTSSLTSPNVVTTNFEHDLTVDVNGNPHLFTTICNGSNAYGVIYTQWHHMVDITQINGIWLAHDVANVLAGRGTWGVAPNAVSMDMAPQVSRSADGTKVFFSWSDNSNYTLGQANLSPNFFSKGLNIANGQWTPTKNFSSCNPNTDGKMLVPHAAAEVLEPGLNQFKLAPVYGEYSVSNDPLQISNFKFLDNCLFTTSEFTVAGSAPVTFSIAQGSPILLCPSSTVNVGLLGSGFGQYIWSTGATGSVLPISTSTLTTYSVIAQQNCNIGTATLTVTNMTVTAAAPTASFCYGTTLNLTASGNASVYTWNPGNITGTNAVITATNIPIYTLTAGGTGGCTFNQTVAVNALTLPTVSVAGDNTVCIGSSITLTASGASTYAWNNGSTGATAVFTPTLNTICILIGTDANGCSNTASISVQTLQVPIVSAISDKNNICAGTPINLTASGAQTYSWSNGGVGQNTTSTPTVSTVYSVTGYDANLCSTIQTVAVNVYPLPAIGIVSNRTLVCKGEKAVLTASGAATYTWNTSAKTTTIQISPTTSTNYTVIGTDANGCVNTMTFAQVVSDCVGLKDGESVVVFSVYPNPSNGTAMVKAMSKMMLTVFNQLGQQVADCVLDQNNNYSIKLTELAVGVYYLLGENEEGRFVHKLVVKP